MEAAVVSASTGVIKSVLAKFSTLLEKEYKLINDVKKDISSLRVEMSGMRALLVRLADMEPLDVQQKVWRDQVRELAYDTEDCIDISMHELGDGDAKAGIMNRLKTLKADRKIGNIIKQLKSRAVEISANHNRYKLDEGTSGSCSGHHVAIDPRVQALYTEAADLVGIDEPRDQIMKWLVEGEEGAQLKVVSIVGPGGMGKTTIANQVYIKCKQHFECAVFVSVSQNPNLVDILRNILSEVGYRGYLSHHLNDERLLIDHLREHLGNKRYLFVIDDLWKAEAWNIIKCFFVENNCGSRVIVTTRIEDIAKACCSFHGHVYKIKPLNDLDSRKLFDKRIFVPEDACPDQLIEVRDQIIKCCEGVPLAILSVASILASHEGVKLKKTWDKIHNFLGIQLETNPALEWMRHVLNLSYNDLSKDLKICVLYFGIFPEDYIIMKDDLMRRWIAEGFVGESYGFGQDEVAESYFNDLINRSIIQIAGFDDCGEVMSCRMHDIMLEFIISKATEENFITVINNQHSTKGSLEVRRLSVQVRNTCSDHVLANMALTQARSFNFWGPAQLMRPLSKFQLLRVLYLDISASKDEKYDLPYISNLFQLKYLRTRGIPCKKLVPQLQKLQHLRTLEIFGAIDILQLDVRKLPSTLWHLSIPNVELVGGIGRMRTLRTLDFALHFTDIESIKDIGELSNLRDLKIIDRPSLSKRDACNFLLSSLCRFGICNLRSLTICSLFGRPRDILTCWSPPPRQLRRLHVLECPFSIIPEWIAPLDMLSSLEIEAVALSKDGIGVLARLPSLLHLRLHVQDHVPEEGVVVCSTAFQNLKEFWFRYKVPCLTFEAGTMPRLQSLSMDCYGYAHGVGHDDAILAGIEHLGSVMVFKMQIYKTESFSRVVRPTSCKASVSRDIIARQRSEMQNLVAALRKAMSKHMGSPHVIIETIY